MLELNTVGSDSGAAIDSTTELLANRLVTAGWAALLVESDCRLVLAGLRDKDGDEFSMSASVLKSFRWGVGAL
jgi:hypothetical protein